MRATRVAAWLAGRDYATPEDVQAVFVDTLAHRLCFQPVYEMRRTEIAGPLMAGILQAVAAP
jgi:MoxR-like ATPase